MLELVAGHDRPPADDARTYGDPHGRHDAYLYSGIVYLGHPVDVRVAEVEPRHDPDLPEGRPPPVTVLGALGHLSLDRPCQAAQAGFLKSSVFMIVSTSVRRRGAATIVLAAATGVEATRFLIVLGMA